MTHHRFTLLSVNQEIIAGLFARQGWVFASKDDQDRRDTPKLEQKTIATKTARTDDSKSRARNTGFKIRNCDCVTTFISHLYLPLHNSDFLIYVKPC
jgi:hypothetical protein